jgi:dTDP-4-amino-4,6-dideoxygalactose transaminase
LVLSAWKIGPGDAVFVPAFTFAATAAAPALLGATPVFVDVLEATFNMDAQSLRSAARWARMEGLRPKVVIAVDLFGQPADYGAMEEIAEAEGLRVLCDAAQSFGATLDGRAVGTIGAATTTSFYPAKPLGCYGDGGAVFTDDSELAAQLRSRREHGFGSHRYEHVRVGVNSRLDAIQAAVLIEKLGIFSEELRLRQDVADRYRDGLSDLFAVPEQMPGASSSWAQFTLRTEHRDAIAAACRSRGVPTAIHYPIPLSKQPAYRAYPCGPGGVPVSERLAETVLSLPMHPYLDAATQDVIMAAVASAVPRRGLRAGVR